MLFRRRTQPAIFERLRLLVLPRRSYRRSFTYFGKRVIRLSASPHAIAAGVATGVATSCTPFVGFHIILSLPIAYILRGNMLAAGLAAGAIGNPLILPFLWVASFSIGNFLLHFGHGGAPHAPHGLADGIVAGGWHAIVPLLKPMTLGAIPLGLGLGAIFYVLVRWGLTVYQQNRRNRLARRRATLLPAPTGVAPSEEA